MLKPLNRTAVTVDSYWVHTSRFLILVVILVAACGSAGATGVSSTTTTTDAPTTSTTATTAVASTTTLPATSTTHATPDDELASEPETLAEFEAFWLCELSRRSYVDLTEMESLRNDVLESAGFTEAEYLEFREGLDQDPDTRAEVMDSYLSLCAGD